MSLDKLKENWDNLEEDAHGQSSLSQKGVKEIIQEKYKISIYKLMLPDLVSLAFGGYFTALLVFQFHLLTPRYLAITGVLLITVFLTLPIARLILILNLFRLKALNETYVSILEKFIRTEILLKRLNHFKILSSVLMVFCLSVIMVKIYNEFDIIKSTGFWIVSFLLGLGFSGVFYKWVLLPFKKNLKLSKEFLKQLV